MEFQRLAIDGVVEVLPKVHGDPRGSFSETFRADSFAEVLGGAQFVQDNQAFTKFAGTIRGLHFQHAPHAQGKLVRCLVGEIFDVAVDVRPESPQFGQWLGVTLSAASGNQLYVPEGFLHGYCTLTDDTLVAYKCTDYYAKSADAGVTWRDPMIGITWPDCVREDLLSGKDQSLPRLIDSGIPIPPAWRAQKCG